MRFVRLRFGGDRTMLEFYTNSRLRETTLPDIQATEARFKEAVKQVHIRLAEQETSAAGVMRDRREPFGVSRSDGDLGAKSNGA